MVVDKIRDRAPGFGGFVGVVGFIDLFHQRMQQRQYPAVYLGALCYRNGRVLVAVLVDVGIQHEKRIRVVERAEEFTAGFLDAFHIETQIIPRRSIGDHIPAQRVGAVLVDG